MVKAGGGRQRSQERFVLRSSMTLAGRRLLLPLLLLVAFGALFHKISVKTETEQRQDEALRRILQQHGGDIRAVLSQDLEWFRAYLGRLQRAVGAQRQQHHEDTAEDYVDHAGTERRTLRTTMAGEPAAVGGAHSGGTGGSVPPEHQSGALNSLDMPRKKGKHGVMEREHCHRFLQPRHLAAV
eukprot:SM004612S16471  [mRNA]  locus=s4612:138:1096:- [translate_table: standard]